MNTPGQPHRQWTTPQEVKNRLADIFRGRPVHLLQPKPERQIQQQPILLDGVVGQFGQFVVAENKMDLPRVHGLQPGDVLQDRVRHATAVLRIDGSSVADLLENQMAARILVECGEPADQVEIPPVTMNVARRHHLVAEFRSERDRASLPAWHLPVRHRWP